MPTKSLPEIRKLFEKLFPEQTSRLRCLFLLAESIKHAHCYAPDEWVVRLHPNTNPSKIRLIVGHRIAIQVWRGKVWVALDAKELKAIPQAVMLLNEAKSWQWEAKDDLVFKYTPARSGYYFPDKDPSREIWSVVRQLNFAFIKFVGKSKRHLYHSSRVKYEPAIIEFLHRELKQPIPEPGSDLELREEISEIEALYEGARRQILVNAYERNRIARDKCLKRYGFRCVVCNQCMSEIYGTVAEELIHVHHCQPLSEIQEDYEVDPIKHLRPVCPNCHAVIHRRKPPYTIEEVKGFLEKAKQDV